MSLPIINLPKYEVTLPASKMTIEYRPFIVREEKILLLAIEEAENEKISKAIVNVMEGCTFGKVDVKNLPQTDLEFLFLKVRNKSMGEMVEAVSTCIHCGKKNLMNLNFDNITVEYKPGSENDTIKVSDNVWVKMKYPNIELSYKMLDAKSVADVSVVVARCIVSVIDGDNIVSPDSYTPEQLGAWVDSLGDEAFAKLGEYLQTAPVLKFEQEYKCVHCHELNLISMEGLESFFV